MARLAEITKVLAGAKNEPVLTIYVNPANVTSLEPSAGGTRISLTNGGVYQTIVPMPDIVKIMNDAMA
jgi:hypothetical protein